MTLASVLVLMLVVAVALMALTNFSVTAARMSVPNRERASALSLAEAGVDDTVDRLRANSAYNVTGAVTTVTNADGTTAGTFTVTTKHYPPNEVDIFSDGQTPGTAPIGQTSKVYARVHITGDPRAAILSNGDVSMASAARVKTSPEGGGYAHVRANDDVTMAPDNFVDGRVSAVDSVSNVKCSDPLFPKGQANAAPIPFPTQTEINAWKTQWISEATAGGTTTGLIETTRTITAPEYISGDIALKPSETLTITGSGTVYVTGNVLIRGKLVISPDVTLVVAGTFTMASASDASLASGSSTSGSDTGSRASLMVLSTNLTSAISISAKAQCNAFSTLYAVNGGMDCYGGATVSGQLKAGGAGATVTLRGGFTLSYPSSMGRYVGNPSVVDWVELPAP